MRRLQAIALLLLGLSLAACDRQQTYRRYAAQSDLDVAYIEHFPTDDGGSIDVTTIRAAADSSWNRLRSELAIPADTAARDGGLHVWCSPQGHPEQRIGSPTQRCDLVAASPSEHTVCIFHIRTDSQMEHLIDRMFDRIDQQ